MRVPPTATDSRLKITHQMGLNGARRQNVRKGRNSVTGGAWLVVANTTGGQGHASVRHDGAESDQGG